MKKKMLSVALAGVLATVVMGCASGNGTSTPSKEVLATNENTVADTENSDSTEKTDGNYPTKQISIICPYSAGGAADTVSRAVAAELQNNLGVPVVVVNKTGAAGAVGLAEGKAATPDGYTITYIPVESTFLKYLGMSDVTADDFELLGRVMQMPASILVRADSQWNTLDEFISYAKDHPAEITVGNPGSGSNFYMAAKALEHEAGVQFTHVPFDGSSAAITALLGGNISAASIAPGEAAANIGEGGDLKVLSLLSGNASTTFPEIPVAKDLGYNVSFQGWASFGVPLNTPEDVVKILEEGLAKAADTDTVKNVLSTKGFDYAYLNAADMTAFAKEEQAKYENIVTELELK